MNCCFSIEIFILSLIFWLTRYDYYYKMLAQARVKTNTVHTRKEVIVLLEEVGTN